MCIRDRPTVGEDPSAIDEQEAITMLRTGIDGGINYVDTAYPYHGGKSETLVGKALQEGYRGKVHLATKMPSWLIESQADMTHRFEEQLQRMQTDHVEFYLLHALNACLLYTSPSPRDRTRSRMPSSA